MALKTVLESMDGIDDAVKALYAEDNGRFILQIEDVDNHPELAPFKRAYERVKADNQAVKSERDALKLRTDAFPKDFDPKVWEKAKDGKADEAKLVEMRAELESRIEAEKLRADTAEQRLVKSAVERDLGDALVEAGINNPTFAKAARTMLSDMVKTDDGGMPIVESDMGPMALGDYVKKWAASEGKDFVTPPTGGDRKASTGGKSNPLIDKVPALADLPEK